MNKDELRKIIKENKFIFSEEPTGDYYKFTIIFSKKPEKMLMITLMENDNCVFSYFKEKELIISDSHKTKNVINAFIEAHTENFDEIVIK